MRTKIVATIGPATAARDRVHALAELGVDVVRINFAHGTHESAARVIEWTRDRDAVHPNQKPVQALYPLLDCYAPKGGLVLDPFMGSGSTLRACKDMGFRAVGIEIEDRWCQFAAERLRQGVLFT